MIIQQAINIMELDSVPTIDQSMIKKAYRSLQKTWHPDLHIGKVTLSLALEKSKKINNAYEVLSEYIEINGPINSGFDSKQKTEIYQPKHQWSRRTFTPGFPNETAFEIFVKSTNLFSVGYSKHSQVLYIKFRDNSVYEYKDVPESVFEQLLLADSLGKFAHMNIYHHYSYRRCNEPNRPYKGPKLLC